MPNQLIELERAIHNGADRIIIEKRHDGNWMVISSDQRNVMYNMILVGFTNSSLFIEIFDFCKTNRVPIFINQGFASPSGLMLGRPGSGKGFHEKEFSITLKYRRLFNGWFCNHDGLQFLINIEVPNEYESIEAARSARLYADFHITDSTIKIGVYEEDAIQNRVLICEYDWKDWLSYRIAKCENSGDSIPCSDQFQEIFSNGNNPDWSEHINEIGISVIATYDLFNQNLQHIKRSEVRPNDSILGHPSFGCLCRNAILLETNRN